MFRPAVLAGFLCQLALLFGQQAEPALVQAQALVDQGRFSEAQQAVTQFLEAHHDSADAHYLLAFILFREGNPKASLAEYQEAGRYRAPGALDLEAIGGDYFLLEDYTAADAWFTKSLALNPGDPRARYYLGRAKYNEKRFAEAVEAFTECLRSNSKNAKAADYLGLSYERLGKIEEALAAYRVAVSLESERLKDAAPFLDLGALLAGNNQAGEAVGYLRQAVQIAPGNERAHEELGKAFLAQNRLDEAQAELEKAAALEPDKAPLHFLMAQVYRRRGLADKARAESERYTALTGTHSSPETPLAGARTLLDLGKLNEAEQAARRYLEVHLNSADAHYLLGYILFKKQEPKASLAEYTEGAKYRRPGAAELEAVASDYVLLKDYPDADKWFTKAIELNPTDSLGWYYLGRTKYNENRFEEAISAFQQCLKLDPRNVKAEDNLGLSYEGLNQIEKALAAYRTAISWQADAPVKNSGPYLDLGSLLVDNDRVEEGMPYLLEALRMSPQDYRVHRQLGKAYAHLNKLDQARAELEKAVELAPENAPVHFMLAQVYRKQGLQDKAKMESDRYVMLTGTKSAPEN